MLTLALYVDIVEDLGQNSIFFVVTVLLLRLPLALVGVDELGVEVHLEVGVDSVRATGLLIDAEVGTDLGWLDVRCAEVCC